MKKRTKPRRARKEGPSRPSYFFLIVLALGMIFLAILFLRGIGRTAPPGMPGSPPAQSE
jgi:hypothetical protein